VQQCSNPKFTYTTIYLTNAFRDGTTVVNLGLLDHCCTEPLTWSQK